MNATKVPLAGIKSRGEPISPDEISRAIDEHARATGTRREFVEAMVDRKELVAVMWSEGSICLLYNSPNGL